jgi:hypothetical protein
MSPLPTPSELVADANEAAEFLEQLHQAWENAGGDEEMLLSALVALGAATGIDEAALGVLAEAGTVTVTAYLSACVACLATTAAESVWAIVASNDTQPWLQNQLRDEANQQGIAQPNSTATV